MGACLSRTLGGVEQSEEAGGFETKLAGRLGFRIRGQNPTLDQNFRESGVRLSWAEGLRA